MFKGLINAFRGKPEPRPHHEVLIEEAEKTGDDARLMAEIIVNWSWDTYKQRPFMASAAEFVEQHAPNGYKPASDLSDDEKKDMSPRKLFICEALDSVQKSGHLDGKMGHALRHFSETGVIVKPATDSRQPAPA